MLFSSENKLLMRCISSETDEDAIRASRKTLKRSLDWSYFLSTAEQSGATSFIYYNLQQLGIEDAVPMKVREQFKRIYYGTGYHNAIFHEELKKIVRSLDSLGIRVIILKGAALAETVWKNIAPRQMWDIDLLVQRQDLGRAEWALYELGYMTYRSKEFYKTHHHLAPCYNPENGIIIELHHHIIPPGNDLFDILHVWERAELIRIGGMDAHVLCAEDLFIHLCLHLSYTGCHFKNNIGKIKNLVDISQALKHYDGRINWDSIIREAETCNFTDFLYYPLYLAKEVLNSPLEKDILKRLKSKSHLRVYEDYLLRFIMKKNVLPKNDSSFIFPAWILDGVCRDLMPYGNNHNKIQSLWRTLLLPPHEPTADSFPPSFPGMTWLCFLIRRLFKLIFRLSDMFAKDLLHK